MSSWEEQHGKFLFAYLQGGGKYYAKKRHQFNFIVTELDETFVFAVWQSSIPYANVCFELESVN